MKARQKKKLRRDSIITLDLATLPGDMDISEWLHVLRQTHVIFWDSFAGGTAPTVFPSKNKRVYKIKDKHEKLNI